MPNYLSLLITGIKVRVYCQVGKANQGRFALDVAVKTLELYKEYVLHSNLMEVDHYYPQFSNKKLHLVHVLDYNIFFSPISVFF